MRPVTHAELAAAVAEIPGLEVLASAAERSADPAIRAMATIGGNLPASDFAAADCVPALLSASMPKSKSRPEAIPSGIRLGGLPQDEA